MKIKFTITLLVASFIFVACNLNNKIHLYPSNNATDTSSSSISISSTEESNNNSYLITDNTSFKLDEIIKALDETIGEYKDNISLYYYNFDTKEEYSINEDVYHITASLKKIPLAMQVLDKVHAGELTLDTEIEYLSSDFSDGTGILQFKENIGSQPISYLLELSMTESDNIAFNMMNRLCGYTLTEYIDNILGENSMLIENNSTKLTSKHNFQILHRLYTNPDANPYYSSIIDYLKNTAFNDSMNKYIPKDKVAHKIGSYFRSYHDSGIIFAKETFLLVVLTKDIGELTVDPEFNEDDEDRYLIDWGKEAFELIAQISKCIYNIIENS